VGFADDRRLAAGMCPEIDRLVVAGDVAEHFADVEWALRTVPERAGTE
jgi:hypothetical protein